MKKGFTILELLVASLLLGMLMTVLTMVFNQSSISWRVGKASISDLDDVSDGVSAVHDVADNLYVWDGKSYLLTSIWEEKERSEGQTLKQTRPLASEGGGKLLANVNDEGKNSFVMMFRNVDAGVRQRTSPGMWGSEPVGTGVRGDPEKLYTVNVKSAGPNKKFDDYDDIWSFPDEFN